LLPKKLHGADLSGDLLDDVQRTVLTRCADWAAAHSSVGTIYIFGSIARGDYGPASDVDIFVRPQLGDLTDHSIVEDFTELHGEADGFSILLGHELRREVHIHGMVLRESEDHAWPAIVAASATPVATRGKAMVVATPKRPSGSPTSAP
jgi:predicted nucleotidyltransferase